MKIIKVKDWNVPSEGNKHFAIYGTVTVSDGEVTKDCKAYGTKINKWDNGYSKPYIMFNRKRYSIDKKFKLNLMS